MTRPHLRHAATTRVQGLVVAHGFTLSVSGTLALAVGRTGYPGFLAVWLFVVGGSVTFAAANWLLGRTNAVAAAPPEPFHNLAAIPVVAVTGAWVHFVHLGTGQYAVTGGLCVGLYLLGIGSLGLLKDAKGRLRRTPSLRRISAERPHRHR